ncbi:MAG: hypothetical protein ACREXJ_11180 [Gammaproteobacteria bacterium]
MISPDVEKKLWVVHALTNWDVQRVVFDPGSEVRWDVDDEHGGRVIVRGRKPGTQDRAMYVALRLVDPDRGVWACITAFVPDDENYGAEEV